MTTTTKYKTIGDLLKAVRAKEIDEEQLHVVLDNDCTNFYVGPFIDDDGEEIDNKVRVSEASGYCDIEPLYQLLFPKASVGWC